MTGSRGIEKRLAELERRRGAHRLKYVWMPEDASREAHERLRQEARAEVGPGGRVIEIHTSPDWPPGSGNRDDDRHW